MSFTRTLALILVGWGGALAGCTSGTSGPALPQLQLPGEASLQPITTTEAYARIAAGAMVCWFGPRGRFAKTHVFYADADSPARGGAVEIIVHERAAEQPKPFGYRAFHVVLTKVGDQTRIEVENLKMGDLEASRMRSEVFGWVGGGNGCAVQVPEPPKPPIAAPRPGAEPKVKAAAPRT